MKKVSLFLVAAAASMALVGGAPHVILTEDVATAFSAPVAATKDCRTCYASCYRNTACIAECVRICAAEKPNGLEVVPTTSTPVNLTPCQAACKLTADAAKALCKFKRKDRRDHCEWQVAQALDVCNTACDLKIEEPIVEVAAPAKKSQVGFYSCDACSGDYSQCSDSCSPGDASCLSSCVDMFMGCMGPCEFSVSGKAPLASTPVGDCPCDWQYEVRCLPSCMGKNSCQTKCMQDHFDCRMNTPGCFKAQAPVAATPVSMSCTSCKPALADCKSTCATIECDANCNFEYGKCANHCSNEVSLGATPVGDAKKQTLCHMTCIGVEAAANTACKKWLPGSTVCLENVAAARQMCDLGCGLFKAPVPVSVPAQDAASCEEACSDAYSKCQSPCQDLACAAICDNNLNWCKLECPKAIVESEKKPVEGVACVAACKLASKAASAACKFQKPSHRARCKENVAKVETDCEAACVLIPTVKVTETTKPQSHHSTVGAPAFALAESEYQKHFTSFVQKHGKKYTRDEFFPRYSIFKANLNKIHTHNAKGLSYSMAVNEFADMTFTEFHAKMTGYKRLAGVRRSTQGPHTMLGRAQLASSVDWRQKNAVTPVKNQQQCGSCWSFSATGSTEGAHAIKTGNLVSLSEQQLVDCSAAQGNQGCNGGMMDAAFQYIIANGGITTEQAYPYTATQGTCQTNVTVAATLTSFVDVTSGSETALMQAVNIGPVSVAIEADQQCFQFYSGGVLSDPSCGTNLDHGVLVVGYGTDNTVSPPADYWIVKNSWGDSWGEDGYIRLARGSNECGIATEPSYPVV